MAEECCPYCPNEWPCDIHRQEAEQRRLEVAVALVREDFSTPGSFGMRSSAFRLRYAGQEHYLDDCYLDRRARSGGYNIYRLPAEIEDDFFYGAGRVEQLRRLNGGGRTCG